MQPASIVRFDDRFSAEIIARGERGERTVRFLGDEDVYAAIDRLGHMPLPPYIKRDDRPSDRERYQTVFARERGSVAAPTAGLHFTGEILDRVRDAERAIAHVTLHVGLGRFNPSIARTSKITSFTIERYSISEESWREIESAQRVIAVGTTSVRTLESAARTGQRSGSTNLFIYPGYRVPPRGRDADQLPSAAHQPAAAGLRVRRHGTRARGLSARGRGAVPLLLLRRLHADL